jgi:hypothetical protein
MKYLRNVMCLVLFAVAVSNISSAYAGDKTAISAAKQQLVDVLYLQQPEEYRKISDAGANTILNSADLALEVLVRIDSPNGLHALANISCLRIDGALSENYSCAVLGKGKSIVPMLKALTSNACEANWKDVRTSWGKSAVSVLTSASDFDGRKADLLDGLAHNQKCEE